jgi:hypothetical protein
MQVFIVNSTIVIPPGLSKRQRSRRSITKVCRGSFTRRCKKQKLRQGELTKEMGKYLRVKNKIDVISLARQNPRLFEPACFIVK